MSALYTNVTAPTLDKLDARVNASCSSGEWRPQGGASWHEPSQVWVQTLVRVAAQPAPKPQPVKLKGL
jgi:hypothetical protein